MIHTKKECLPLLETVNPEGGKLICIAGRPGMGKTALALHLAMEYAKTNGKTVYIFSLELSATQIYDRLLIALSEVDSYTFREKLFSERDKENIKAARGKLSELHFIIDDTASLTVKELADKTNAVDNLGMIIIDGLLPLVGKEKAEERYKPCRAIVRELKRLAKHVNIPIFFTSQLSRSVERRRDKRPRLTDLRDVGGSEVDVDTVCLLYREGYYEPFENAGTAEIIIPQNIHGLCGTVPLKWQGEFMKFSEEK